MRKIKLLFAVMLCIMGSAKGQAQVTGNADLSNSKVYTVTTARGAWWVDQENNRMHYNADYTPTSETATPTDDVNYQFAFINYEDHYYLYAPAVKKFVQPQKYFIACKPTPITLAVDGGNVKAKAENSDLTINIGGGQWTWDTWTSYDDGNKLTIVEAADFSAEDLTEAITILNATHFDPHKVYTIACERVGQWAASADHNSLSTTKAYSDATDEEKQFAFYYDEDGKLYIFSVGAGKFLSGDGTFAKGTLGEPMDYRIVGTGGYDHVLFIPSKNFYFNSQDAGGYAINGYNSPDAGNKQQIVEVEGADAYDAMEAIINPSFTVQYVVKDEAGNKLFQSDPAATSLGEKITTLPTEYQRVFYSYNTVDITISEPSTIVEFTATWEGPFEISADYASAHWYNMTIRGSYYVAVDETEPYYPKNNKNLKAEESQWAFTGNSYDGITVLNKAKGEGWALTKDGNNAVMREGSYSWTIGKNSDGFTLRETGTANNCINQSGGSSGPLSFWNSANSPTDNGSTFRVTEVPVSVTYEVYYNDEKVTSVTVDQIPGSSLAIPSALENGYVTYSEISGKVTEDGQVVKIDASWTLEDLPFQVAPDFEHANWQNLAMREKWYVTSSDKDKDGALLTVNANATGLVTDAYKWAFIGTDPYHIMLVNKAEGEGRVFVHAANTNQGIPAFANLADVENMSDCYWHIRKSKTSIENAFVMNALGTNLSLNQFGGEGGSLKFWDSSNNLTDGGSAFTIFDVPTNFAEFTTDIEATMKDNATGYFTLNAETKALWKDDYKTECNYDTYVMLKEAVDDRSNWIWPETGFYILKNKYYGTYMGIDPSDANMYGNYKTATAAKNIVKLTKNGEGIYSICLMDKYAPATVGRSAQVTAATDAGTYTAVITTTPGYAAFSPTPESQFTYMHCASGGSIVGWEPTADATLWSVADATSIELTVGEAGYATAYLPFAVEMGKISVPAAKETWTFDDGTTGSLTATEGVTVADGIATVPVGDNLAMATGATELGTYSFMFDVMLPADKGTDDSLSPYSALFQNKPENDDDGSLFIYWHKTNGRRVGVNAGGLGYGGSIDVGTWYRIVFVSENSTATVYVNGEKTGAATSDVAKHWTLKDKVLFFTDNDGEENEVKADEIRFWDVALNANEVAMLGAYGTAESEPQYIAAYTAVINQTWLDLVPVEGRIPAYTAVILKGDAATYKFAIPAINEEGGDVPEGALPIFEEEIESSKALVKEEALENNVLKGTLEPIDAAGKYVLAKPEGEEKVGFYLAETGKIAATKAYLELPDNTGPLVKAFYFAGEDATGVKTIDNGQQTTDGPIYNIAGQRLGKMQKGINIMNGKKVLR